MKKIRLFVCFFLSAVILVLPCFAVEYRDLEELVNDVAEVIPPYEPEETNVVNDNPVDVTVDSNAIGAFDPSTLALNDMVDLLASESTQNSFNIESAQVLYLRAIAASNPFMDYVLTYDGQYTYGLYYGYNLSAGKDANYAYVTRYQSNNRYYYEYNTGLNATVPNSGVYVSSIDKTLPKFVEVENAKHEIIIEICCCVALGIWTISKIFFR